MKFSALASALVVLTVGGSLTATLRADDLTATLPNGKVITFQNAEQKARYEAALQQRTAAARATTPAATPSPSLPSLAQTASTSTDPLSAAPVKMGHVNTKSPQFTAEYYLADPASWQGKNVALSIGYLDPHEKSVKDGKEYLLAATYNVAPGAKDAKKSFGGTIKVVADPAFADRMLAECGTEKPTEKKLVKTMFYKGEIRPLDSDPAKADAKSWAFFVTQK